MALVEAMSIPLGELSKKKFKDIVNELEHTNINDIGYSSEEEAKGIGKGLQYAIDLINKTAEDFAQFEDMKHNKL